MDAVDTTVPVEAQWFNPYRSSRYPDNRHQRLVILRDGEDLIASYDQDAIRLLMADLIGWTGWAGNYFTSQPLSSLVIGMPDARALREGTGFYTEVVIEMLKTMTIALGYKLNINVEGVQIPEGYKSPNWESPASGKRVKASIVCSDNTFDGVFDTQLSESLEREHGLQFLRFGKLANPEEALLRGEVRIDPERTIITEVVIVKPYHTGKLFVQGYYIDRRKSSHHRPS